ncbi:hypothetical protein [Actinoplanes sp. NPDC026670]|uniref:hypothetical protein n=1 Tax=Actinoplanes sp. NPDC026670 TaxID=3154700 RepID=UPI0033DD016D
MAGRGTETITGLAPSAANSADAVAAAIERANRVPQQDAAANRVTETTGVAAAPPSDVWQARVSRELSAKLLEDAEFLGLASKTEVVKAALELLHRHATEIRMAEGVKAYYEGERAPLPAGVVPFDPSELDDDDIDE